jgi:MFS family permease
MPKLLVDIGPLKRNRNFRLLYLGQLVSILGSNLTVVAIPYQVYRDTHSSLWVGLASLIQLPFLVTGSLWGGAFGDRFDKRTLMIVSAFVLALTSSGLALNARLDDPYLAPLLLLGALAAGLAGFSGPLRTAAIPTLVSPEELIGAYSLNQVAINIATIVGPAAAGVLIATVGLYSCYAIDALSFLVSMAMCWPMSAMPASGDHSETALLRAIADGFGYVRRHAIAQAVYLVDLNAMVFGLPRALFPAVALTLYHGGPKTLGLLYAAPGAGAFIMALFTGWIAHVRRQGRLVALVVTAWGAAMTVFGLVHILVIGLVCLGVAGAMDVISTVLRNTILQNAITDEYRSRISAIQMAVVTGGPRLGDVESGVVANFTSTEFSIVSGGVACIIGVLALIRWRPTFWRVEALGR